VFDYAAGKRDPPPGPWPLPKELDLVIARMSAAFGVTPENPPSAAASDYNFALVAVRVVVFLLPFLSLLFLSVCRRCFENIRHCWVLKMQAIFLLLEPKSSMRSS
jgi:hypothetical protein